MTINSLWAYIRAENPKECDALSKVIDYIEENEKEDFYENPSTNHIYFYAILAGQGKSIAFDALHRAESSLKIKR